MKFNYRLLVGAVALIALAGACSKKYKQPDTVEPNVVNPFGGPPSGNTTGSLVSKLDKDLSSTPEKQCVTAGVLQTVTFTKGTRLIFYPNSFKDKGGNIITSGTICIEIIEMYKPGDMIANNATTMSSEGILQSGGQVHIKATKDGQEVFANKYGIGFKQAQASTQAMHLYYGKNNNKDSVVTWGNASTLPGTTTSQTTDIDTTMDSPYYFFDSSSVFTYTNCDLLMKYPNPKVNIKAIISGVPIDQIAAVRMFLVIPEVNAVVSFQKYDAKTRTAYISDKEEFYAPLGKEVGIVVIYRTADGSTYYFEKKEITTYEGMSVNCAVTKMTIDEVKAKLAAL